MFPTKGCFRYAVCPDFMQNSCIRKYCHFRHKKDKYLFERWILEGKMDIDKIITAQDLIDESFKLIELERYSQNAYRGGIIQSSASETRRKSQDLSELLINDEDPLSGILDLARMDPDYEEDISSLRAPQIDIGYNSASKDVCPSAEAAAYSLTNNQIPGLFDKTYSPTNNQIPGLFDATYSLTNNQIPGLFDETYFLTNNQIPGLFDAICSPTNNQIPGLFDANDDTNYTERRKDGDAVFIKQENDVRSFIKKEKDEDPYNNSKNVLGCGMNELDSIAEKVDRKTSDSDVEEIKQEVDLVNLTLDDVPEQDQPCDQVQIPYNKGSLDVSDSHNNKRRPDSRMQKIIVDALKLFEPDLYRHINEYVKTASLADNTDTVRIMNRTLLLKLSERLDEFYMTLNAMNGADISNAEFTTTINNNNVNDCPHVTTCKSCFESCFSKILWDVKMDNSEILNRHRGASSNNNSSRIVKNKNNKSDRSKKSNVESNDVVKDEDRVDKKKKSHRCRSKHRRDRAQSKTKDTIEKKDKKISASPESELTYVIEKDSKNRNVSNREENVATRNKQVVSSYSNGKDKSSLLNVEEKISSTKKPADELVRRKSIHSRTDKNSIAEIKIRCNAIVSGSLSPVPNWNSDNEDSDDIFLDSAPKKNGSDTGVSSKKRISRVNDSSELPAKVLFSKKHDIPNAKQVMLNRYFKKADNMETTSSIKSSVKPSDNVSSTSKEIISYLKTPVERIRIRPVEKPELLFNPAVAIKQSEEAVQNQKRLDLLKRQENTSVRCNATNSDATINKRPANVTAKSVNFDSQDSSDDFVISKKKQRISHLTQVHSDKKNSVESRLKRGPSVSTFKTSNNIEESIRQWCLDKLYTELARKLPEHIACQKAIEEEQTLHEKVTLSKIYKQSCGVTVLRLSKLTPEELMKTPADIEFPDVIHEIHTYDLLIKHILTEEEYIINGYPILIESGGTIAKISSNATYYKPMSAKKSDDCYICVQCQMKFIVDTFGYPVMAGQQCVFHPGRLRKEYGRAREDMYYTCCSADISQSGCMNNTYHIPDTFDEDRLEGFVETQEPPRRDMKKEFYALDCEMCYTTAGTELARVTVVDKRCNVIFDSYVKPSNSILDYCTKFSGVTEENLKDVTKTVTDIQRDLMKFIFDDTILIGHSLENDLRSLKIVHRNVVDTSVMYPHREAPIRKFGLKQLAEKHINMLIQEGVSGHDSAEDAIACMKLVWKKLKEDGNMYRPRKIIGI